MPIHSVASKRSVRQPLRALARLLVIVGGMAVGTASAQPAERTAPIDLYVGEAHVLEEPNVRRIAVGNGKVLHAGPSTRMHWIATEGTGSIASAGSRADDADSMSGTAVMFDTGRILKAGEEATKKNLKVVTGLHMRHYKPLQEIIARIHDGAIGDVVAIEENFLRGPYGLYPRRPGLKEVEYHFFNQYHFAWLSGDDVPQSLVHNMDRALWVLQDKPPVKCHGLGGRATSFGEIYGDVFDHHSVVYEFDNGVPIYAFCRTTTGCYDKYSSVVFGTKGKADIMGCRIWGETNWRWTGRCDPYQREHDVLFKAIREGKPVNNGDYMVPSTTIALMGQISCYTGQEVTWEQINRSEFYYEPRPEDCYDEMIPPVLPGPNGSYPVPLPGRTRML